MSLLMEKLMPDGILCYHVSNKYIDTVPVIADVAKELNLAVREGFDLAPDGRIAINTVKHAHYSSKWVMVTRDKAFFDRLPPPPGYAELVNKSGFPALPYWKKPAPTGKHIWTDKSRHTVKGLMHSDPVTDWARSNLAKAARMTEGFIPWSKIHPRGASGILFESEWIRSLDQWMISGYEKSDITVEDFRKLMHRSRKFESAQ
jgi:hypothetical protein